MYVDYIVFINYTGFRYPHLHKNKKLRKGFLFLWSGISKFICLRGIKKSQQFHFKITTKPLFSQYHTQVLAHQALPLSTLPKSAYMYLKKPAL